MREFEFLFEQALKLLGWEVSYLIVENPKSVPYEMKVLNADSSLSSAKQFFNSNLPEYKDRRVGVIPMLRKIETDETDY